LNSGLNVDDSGFHVGELSNKRVVGGDTFKIQRVWLLVNKVFERVSINGSSGLNWDAISVLIEGRN